jgi:hypothetical protein
METEREPARALPDLELNARAAELLGYPVTWSHDPYYPPRHMGRMPYLKGVFRGCNYDWARVPDYCQDERLAELLSDLHALGYSWSASGVPIVSSFQQGIVVHLNMGLRPIRDPKIEVPAGTGQDPQNLGRALVRALIDSEDTKELRSARQQ